MIGVLQGEVLFSDGTEIILLTNSGIGHQVFFNKILSEGMITRIYISHVIKEAGEELYGFSTLREKKTFEQLISVKGVGPKSGFNLLGSIGVVQIIDAITMENKKALTKAPGIGPKAAAQIILDLSDKIKKVQMYNNKVNMTKLTSEQSTIVELPMDFIEEEVEVEVETPLRNNILNEAIMACKELGFNEDKIMILAQKILSSHDVSRAEQLVHLVLKEI